MKKIVSLPVHQLYSI